MEASQALTGVVRYDRGVLRKPRRDATTGFMHVDGVVTRVGVFPYRMADGSVRRELRPASEVLSQAARDSISGSVVTNNHPASSVTRANVKAVQVGHADSNVRTIDATHIAVGLTISDDKAIRAVDQGKRQLSWGYTVDVEEISGVDPVHGQYDAIQRNHRGNHIAIVDHGRAGASCGLALDRRDAEEVQDVIAFADGVYMVTSETGEILGEHDTREAAERQLRAIEAAKRARDGIGGSGENVVPFGTDRHLEGTGMHMRTDGRELAALLLRLMEEKGVSAAQLGSAAGISASTVTQITRAEIDVPPLRRLEGLARALSVPVSRLINTFPEAVRERLRAASRDGIGSPRESGATRRTAMQDSAEKGAVESKIQEALEKRDVEAKAKADQDALQAKLDAALEENKSLKESKLDEEAITKAAEERIAVLDQARKVAKFDDAEMAELRKLQPAKIKHAALTKAGKKLDGKSEAYIEAAFDIAVESAGDGAGLEPRVDHAQAAGSAMLRHAQTKSDSRTAAQKRVTEIQTKLNDNLSKRHPMGTVSPRFAGEAN
jgi:transcriptional regulator with XRE-family HTH domain